MARDEGLEELLSEDLTGTPGLTQKTMFGGLAWLVYGNLGALYYAASVLPST